MPLPKLFANIDKAEKFRKNSLLYGGILLGLIIIFFLLPFTILLAIILFVTSIVLSIKRYKKWNEITKKLKSDIIESISRENQDYTLKYLAKDDIQEVQEQSLNRVLNLIRARGFGHRIVKRWTEESVVGRYKDVQLAISDSKIKIKKGDDDYETHSYQILEADFPDSFNGHTVVISNKSFKSPIKQKVGLEGVEFEKRFKTYSTDQIEARVCLKTNTMQDLIDLHDAHKKGLFVQFLENRVTIAFEARKELFHISLFKPVNQIERLTKDFLADIQKATKFVDELRLNRKNYKQPT